MNIPPSLSEQLVRWRRDFHAYPELGFCEYRTAAKVCGVLAGLSGCAVRLGREVMDPAARAGVPTAEEIAVARAEALDLGADPAWVDRMGDGLTGVVAEWTYSRPGPTVVFRVDMDALPVTESSATGHRPAAEGFASRHPGRMHACGHDGHTAIGLGLATLAAQQGANWGGRLRIIFQPAEEGCRGAPAMVAAGVVRDADYFIAGHIGTAATETGLVSCGTHGWLATTKLDVVLHGVAAHAGLAPQGGRNALLAAATLVLQLHALPRHGAGDTRVNVGILHAGTSRNIIADRAELKLEVRGATTAINEYMTTEARRVIAATAEMHGVRAEVLLAGRAEGAACDAMCKAVVRAAAESLPGTTRAVDSLDTCGSEDATFFINAVQRRGGAATYLLVGTPLAAGHHQPAFDFDEAALTHAVALHAAIADRLLRAA